MICSVAKLASSGLSNKLRAEMADANSATSSGSVTGRNTPTWLPA